MGLLPSWVETISGWSSLCATSIIVASVMLHLKNYRKPFEQRLMIRIQLIVILFAASCYSMLIKPESIFNRFILEPTREIYEAFVIYTFFSLLTLMLGGERNIIINTSGREPVPHPAPFKWIFPPMDISDPFTFLNVKRGILQYVWLKPLICFGTLFAEVVGLYDVNDASIYGVYFWLTLVYNFSVSLSLYCLAIFWKILWVDLKPFNPVGKFLCVKLIIFASYWQGVLLALLSAFELLPPPSDGGSQSIGTAIQNALLCVELTFFAIGHWFSFSYVPFTIRYIPNGRLRFWNAVKDVFGVNDLWHDFQLTFYGDYYKDYKLFDSVEALIAHPESRGRMSRINQGLRYHSNGKMKHWLPVHEDEEATNSLLSTSEEQALASSSLERDASAKKSRNVIENQLMNDNIDYSLEDFDGDEQYYATAMQVINNYNIEHKDVKNMLNYPIVDELVNGHVYGHKVKKLRDQRERTYGSIV